MPHALVTGDRQRRDQVRLRLELLGLTVAVVDPATEVPASVGDCDLLVHAATARHAAVVPRRAAGELPDAPVVLLGDPRPGPWSCVAWEDLDGPFFAAAVQTCVQRACELRGLPVPATPSVRYREFLAHELRSPLAVVTAALEALADDSPNGNDDIRTLVDRALRNVRRLERTVEWSQSSLVLAEAPPVVPRRILEQVEIAELLKDLDCEVATASAADRLLETDPDLLYDVVQQMIRACRCLDPDTRPNLSLSVDDREWVVRLTASRTGGKDSVSRCGLVRFGDPVSQGSLLELASLLIPEVAIQGLDARLQGAAGSPGGLELYLPVAAPALTS